MALSFMGKKKKSKYVGELRKSKITSYAGCGALVEFPGFSGIMGGQNLWSKYGNSHMKIHDATLQKVLNTKYFLQISSEKDILSWKENDYTIPVLRFPEIYYCPSCNELDHVSRLAKNYRTDSDSVAPLICSRCEKELIPSRFVIACEDGHIDDFPYNWWVHKGEKCDNPKLKIRYNGKSSGLESIEVWCETCHKSNTMAGVLSEDTMAHYQCGGRSPWLGLNYRRECKKPVRVLLRSASNVYYPEKKSALTIPPWSSIVQKFIDDNYDGLYNIISLDGEDVSEESKKESYRRFYRNNDVASVLHCSEDEFANQVFQRFSNIEEKCDSDIAYDEYKALAGPNLDDYYFKSVSAEVAEELTPFIKQVNPDIHIIRGNV